VRTGAFSVAGLAVLAVATVVAQVDPVKLVAGLPRMAGWAAKAWPPSTVDLATLFERAAETVAMALVGTTIAVVLSLTLAFAASRNLTPNPLVYYPARWILNAFRSIDSFVFALLFVAAVGLGPFAGVLGLALNTWGSLAKAWSEAIETAAPGPLEAARLAGASRLKTISYVLIPDVLPAMISTALYFFEFNVRASTVLGVVGAGGIGQQLKNSMDLLDFPRLFTVLLVILVMVTTIDQISASLRRRLV
jgi:phosphonate transport system permease protein